MFNPRGVSNSYTLKNNQSLVVNPPTSTTCWKYRKWIGKPIFKNEKVETDQDFFMSALLLFNDCFDNIIYRRLKELSNISPKNIKISESNRIVKTYPINFNWPMRMLQLLSLSLVDPNLTYSGSSGFLNRCLVVLSKQRTISSRLSR